MNKLSSKKKKELEKEMKEILIFMHHWIVQENKLKIEECSKRLAEIDSLLN